MNLLKTHPKTKFSLKLSTLSSPSPTALLNFGLTSSTLSRFRH